jgi:hypothetical protein
MLVVFVFPDVINMNILDFNDENGMTFTDNRKARIEVLYCSLFRASN